MSLNSRYALWLELRYDVHGTALERLGSGCDLGYKHDGVLIQVGSALFPVVGVSAPSTCVRRAGVPQ